MPDDTKIPGSIMDREFNQGYTEVLRSRIVERVIAYCDYMASQEGAGLSILREVYEIPDSVKRMADIPATTRRKEWIDPDHEQVQAIRQTFDAQLNYVMDAMQTNLTNLAQTGQSIFGQHFGKKNTIFWNVIPGSEAALHASDTRPSHGKTVTRITNTLDGASMKDVITTDRALEMMPKEMTVDIAFMKKMIESMRLFQDSQAFDKTGFIDAGLQHAVSCYKMLDGLRGAAIDLETFCDQRDEEMGSIRPESGKRPRARESISRATTSRGHRKKGKADRGNGPLMH
jgi:hypothetical protein